MKSGKKDMKNKNTVITSRFERSTENDGNVSFLMNLSCNR